MMSVVNGGCVMDCDVFGKTSSGRVVSGDVVVLYVVIVMIRN